MLVVTELEKRIYNKHLAISRSQKNKPFRLKQNFSDIVDTDCHKYLKRISTLFSKHPEMSFDVFFKAPYALYPDVEYFGLDYFSTMRAIKAYTMYKKLLFLQDPDSQIEEVKQSVMFIANFCIQQKIQFHYYPHYKIADLYAWMKHYKENKINIYCMFEFSNVFSTVKELSEDVQNFFVRDFIEKFQTLHSNYNKSQCIKPYMKKAFPIISNFVLKNVDNK
jgi:hypothetical protein